MSTTWTRATTLCALGALLLVGVAWDDDPCGDTFWPLDECAEDARGEQVDCGYACLDDQSDCEDTCAYEEQCVLDCLDDTVTCLETCGETARDTIYSCWEVAVE